MKKKILFVLPNLGAGGAEKSLITLLSLIDYEQYEVDLQLFGNEGLFLELLPPQVNLLPAPMNGFLFCPSGGKFKQLLTKSAKLGFGVLMDVIKGLYKAVAGKKGMALSLTELWSKQNAMIPVSDVKYDTAIAYLEGPSTYYVADKTTAVKKFTWVHCNYKMRIECQAFDAPYYAQFDKVVGVSELCSDILKEVFPESASKVVTMYNIVAPDLIHAMAETGKGYQDNYIGTRILSIGRLHKQKGFDMAIEAAAILKQEGHDVRWYILGNGREKEALMRQAEQIRVTDNITFLDETVNPYNYIATADIYIQPSRFEGKSIAVEEAMVLAKPIIITNYATAADQIENGVTGLIVDMEPQAIAVAVTKLIENTALAERLSQKLSTMELGNASEINRLYDWLEDRPG